MNYVAHLPARAGRCFRHMADIRSATSPSIVGKLRAATYRVTTPSTNRKWPAEELAEGTIRRMASPDCAGCKSAGHTGAIRPSSCQV